MDQGKVNLAWNTHHQHLKKLLQNMLEATVFADITLVSNDLMKFKTHKAVLSACSQVFKSIIDDIPKDSSTIYLRGIQGQDLESILQFMYLGEATLSHERMNEFIEVAKSLEIIEIFKNVYTSTEETHALDDDDDFIQESQEKKVIEEQGTEKQQQDVKNKAENYAIPSFDGNFPCNQCDRVLSTSSNRLKHIKSVHEGLRHKCNLCSKDFTQSCHLKKHFQSAHIGTKYFCDQCEKHYPLQNTLYRHQKTKHPV